MNQNAASPQNLHDVLQSQEILTHLDMTITNTAEKDSNVSPVSSTATFDSLTDDKAEWLGDSSDEIFVALKREVRLFKNRKAAKECRQKRKDYVNCLEHRVRVLEEQNKQLIEKLKEFHGMK